MISLYNGIVVIKRPLNRSQQVFNNAFINDNDLTNNLSANHEIKITTRKIKYNLYYSLNVVVT